MKFYNNIDFLFLAGSKHLRLLLSFSVGGMLGDVFLHVLPEVWISSKGKSHNIGMLLLPANLIIVCLFFKDRYGNWIRDGWWVLAGLLVFIIVEKLFSLSDDEEANEIIDKMVSSDSNMINNNLKDVGKATKCNNGVLNKAKSHIQVSYTCYIFHNQIPYYNL